MTSNLSRSGYLELIYCLGNMYTYVCMYTYVYTSVPVGTCMYICVHIHEYMYVYVYTYTDVYFLNSVFVITVRVAHI